MSSAAKSYNTLFKRKEISIKVSEALRKPPRLCKEIGCSNKVKKHSLTGYCKVHFKDEYISLERRKQRGLKISIANKGNTGGYKEGQRGGQFKSGRYKGIWCDSSWELAYLVYQLDQNVLIEKSKEKFKYMDLDGKEKFYHPDFLINGKDLVEIKSSAENVQRVKLKLESVGRPIQLISGKEIEPYLVYARNKHGKDFWKIYDRKEEKKDEETKT